MDQYKKDLNQDLDSIEFWKDFGYTGKQSELPSQEISFVKRRFQYVKPLMQCIKCGKWRQLRYNEKLQDPGYFCDNWTCEMNTDYSKQRYFQ